MDFEEIQEDLSFLADMAGVAQRSKTNRLLQELIEEKRRNGRLPKCPYCAGPIPALDADLCMHCNGKLAWVEFLVCKPDKTAETKNKLEAIKKQRAAKKKQQQIEEQAKQRKWKKVKSEVKSVVMIWFSGCMLFGLLPVPILGAASVLGYEWDYGDDFKAMDRYFVLGTYGMALISAWILLKRKRKQPGGAEAFFCFSLLAFASGTLLSLVLISLWFWQLTMPVIGALACYFFFKRGLHKNETIVSKTATIRKYLKSVWHRLSTPRKNTSEQKAHKAVNNSDHEYWIKREDQIHGPFAETDLVEAVTYKGLTKKDLLGPTKRGPWLPLSSKHIQKMRKGKPLEFPGEPEAPSDFRTTE